MPSGERPAWCTISAGPISSIGPPSNGWSAASIVCSTTALMPARANRMSRRSTSSRCLNSASCSRPARCGTDFGIGPAIRACAARAHLTAPHETALFAMAANRLDDSVPKLACAERWLPDIAWLPDAAGLAVDQCYRALDFLAVWSDEIERDVFLKTADLFRLDVDLIFYDTTTAYFEIDEPDETEQEFAGRLYAPLRRRGHSKEGRDNQPQVIIALAVTRDGMPVRSWVLPGDTADVATVARIKDDLRAWRLGRCLFVGDAGLYSADNLVALSRWFGPLHPGGAHAQAEGHRARGADPARPLQAGGRQPAGQRGLGRRWRATQTLCPMPQSAGGGTRARPPCAAAGRTRRRTDPAGAARGRSSEGSLCVAGVAPFRPLSERRLAGPAAAGCGEGKGGREVRRQVRGDQQRRHAVGRGYRSRIQRRLDRRIPASVA